MDKAPTRRPLVSRWLLAGAVALMLLAGACGGGDDNGGDATTPGTETKLGMLTSVRPKVGEVAPDFALKDARDGETVRTLSEYKGKAIVLNWYASWCGPCKNEIPAFVAAAEAFPDDLLILGVNWQEDQQRAQGILDLFFADYPALLDSSGDVGRHYRVSGLPVTYFLDENLVVRSVRIGEVTEELLVENLALIGIDYVPAGN